MTHSYHPSGKFAPFGPVLIFVSAAIFSIITSLAYSFAIWFNPLIYLSICLPFLWGLAVTGLSSWSVKVGHVRSPILASFFGFLGSIIGYYLHWIIWIDMAINQSKTPLVIGSGKRAITFVPTHIEFQEILDMFGDFSGLVAFLTQVNIHGMWSLIGFEVHGLLYSGIWLGELLIFFITVALFFYRKAQRPYSEDSERFLDKIVLKTPLTVPEDLEVLLDKFHQGDYSYVLSAEPASSPQPQYLQNELYYLDGEDDAYLTVKLFESTGKKSTSTRKVLDKICIPRLQAEQLLKKLK